MREISEILTAKYSSPNSSKKQIRVDCRVAEDELVRYLVPYSLEQTPTGPRVVLNYGRAKMKSDDGKEDINESDIPNEVNDRVLTLRNKIPDW